MTFLWWPLTFLWHSFLVFVSASADDVFVPHQAPGSYSQTEGFSKPFFFFPHSNFWFSQAIWHSRPVKTKNRKHLPALFDPGRPCCGGHSDAYVVTPAPLTCGVVAVREPASCTRSLAHSLKLMCRDSWFDHCSAHKCAEISSIVLEFLLFEEFNLKRRWQKFERQNDCWMKGRIIEVISCYELPAQTVW